jgi:hypothetical protein
MGSILRQRPYAVKVARMVTTKGQEDTVRLCILSLPTDNYHLVIPKLVRISAVIVAFETAGKVRTTRNSEAVRVCKPSLSVG